MHDGRRITLRPADDTDREFLLAVYASTRDDELAVVAWSEEVKAAFLRMQGEAQDAYYRDNYPRCLYLVIEVQGRAVGRLYLDRREREHRLVDIALLPGARGAGLGSTLLRALQAEAETAGRSLTIHVERMNPALRLYRRLGFREVEERGVYLFLEWRAEGVS